MRLLEKRHSILISFIVPVLLLLVIIGASGKMIIDLKDLECQAVEAENEWNVLAMETTRLFSLMLISFGKAESGSYMRKHSEIDKEEKLWAKKLRKFEEVLQRFNKMVPRYLFSKKEEQHIKNVLNVWKITKKDLKEGQKIYREILDTIVGKTLLETSQKTLVESYMTKMEDSKHRTFTQKELWRYYRLQDNLSSLDVSGNILHGLLSEISGKIKLRTELLIKIISPLSLMLSMLIIAMSFVFSRHTQNILKKAHDELEVKVAERTKELQEAQEKLVQSEKLAVVGQLTAGVAHEINNPLGFVRSNVHRIEEYTHILAELKRRYSAFGQGFEKQDHEQMKKNYDKVAEIEKNEDFKFIVQDFFKAINETKNGVDRIEKIIEDLMSFSRKGDDDVSDVNIPAILDKILEIVLNEIKYKCEVFKEYGPTLVVRGSAHKLEQVFMNIVLNAAQSIEKKGMLYLRIYYKGDKVYVEVEDTGKGILKKDQQKIFDPFFTTKQAGKGTGLGLSISYDIIKAHNGEILVDSQLGKGTKITIVLPVHKEEGNI